jgi:hypothetical protein
MLFALSLSKCIANLGEEDLNSLALTDDHISCVSDEFTKEAGSCDEASLGEGQHGETHGGGEKRIEA